MKLAIIRLVIVFPLISRAAFGQAAAINGQISGTVLDPSGAPLVNAKVGATDARTGYQQRPLQPQLPACTDFPSCHLTNIL